MGHWPGSVFLFREASKKIFFDKCQNQGGIFAICKKWLFFCTYISYNPDVPKCKKADFMLSIYPPGLNTGLFHRHMLECPGAGDVSPESGGHPRAGVSMLGTRYNLGISSVYPRYILGVRSSSLQSPAVPLSYGSQQTTHSRCLSGPCPHLL